MSVEGGLLSQSISDGIIGVLEVTNVNTVSGIRASYVKL